MYICNFCKKEYKTQHYKGKCTACYLQIRRNGINFLEKQNKKCAICSSIFFCKKKANYCPKCRNDLKLRRNFEIQRKKSGVSLDVPKKHKNHSGEGHLSAHGYRYITRVGHPNSGLKGRILEHIYVMSCHLGRALFPGENVHHKNGDRSDNRLENLELWNNKQPPGQRVQDKVEWMIEFLKQYGYVVNKT